MPVSKFSSPVYGRWAGESVLGMPFSVVFILVRGSVLGKALVGIGSRFPIPCLHSDWIP